MFYHTGNCGSWCLNYTFCEIINILKFSSYVSEMPYCIENPLVSIMAVGDFDNEPQLIANTDYLNMILTFNGKFGYSVFYANKSNTAPPA